MLHWIPRQASTQRPWVLHCKRKRHFSEFSSGAARGDCGEYRQQQHHHTESSQAADRQRRQRVSTESICVFLFFGEGCEDPLLLLPGCGGRTQHTEGSQQQRTTRRPTSSPEKRTRESLAERRCGRWGDRWSGPRKRHRRTSSYERRRALCGPVPRTRSGSADVPVAVPHGAPGALQGQRRAHWGWWRGAVDYFFKTHLKE